MARTSLQGKIAIVTGASSGIGKETALTLARRGACVALGSRSTTDLEQVAEEIRDLGQEALVVTTDVTRQDQVERLVQEALSRWSRVDILIANSGQYIRAPIREVTALTMERSMAVNFYGGLYAILAVLPHMLARSSGHIVLVSTLDAKRPIPPDAPYVAAKCALSSFFEVLRQELQGSGVYTTAVFPGRVDTPMVERLNFPWFSAKISAERVAKDIVGGIERRQTEIILPSHMKLLYYMSLILGLFSPTLLDRILPELNLEGWEKQEG